MYTCKHVCFIYKQYSLADCITKLSHLAASLRRNTPYHFRNRLCNIELYTECSRFDKCIFRCMLFR